MLRNDDVLYSQMATILELRVEATLFEELCVTFIETYMKLPLLRCKEKQALKWTNCVCQEKTRLDAAVNCHNSRA